MQIKTITTVSGVNEIDFGNDDSQTTAHFYWFKNLSDSTLYVSATPNPVAGEDNVAELPAKGAASVETDEGKVYILGAGKVEIHRTNSKFCPFELPSTGSGGGGGGFITVDSELSETSENPLQNKATTTAINEVKSDLAKTQENVAENAAALNTKSDINHIHDITASGNPVTLTNLQGGVPFSEITVSGKNLITYPYYSTTLTNNGVTFTDNGDGTITANGTVPTGKVAYFGIDNLANKLIPGVTYTLTGCPEGGGNDKYSLYISERNDDDSSNGKYYLDYGNGITFEMGNYEKYNITIQIRSGVTVDNLVFRPQIELGSTPTEYEPPITGRELQVNVSGKNLIPYPYQTVSKSVGNLNIEINDNGEIIINGSHTSDVWIDICVNKNSGYYIPLFKGKTYKLSGVPKNSETYMQMSINKSDGTRDIALYSGTYDSPAYTVPEDGMYGLIIIRCPANVTYSNFIIKPQLEFGSTATPYEPYNGSTTTITPDSNPYVVLNDIRQVEGLNNISVSAGELSVVGVQKNAAIDKIWDILNTLKVWASLGLIPDLNCYPLIPTLISNTGSNGTASCNSDVTFGTAESAYVAFDGDTTTFLAYANENVSGGWAMYEFNSPVCISKMQALTGIGMSTNSFDFHFEYYDESTDSWKMYGEELNVTSLNANNYKKFEVEAGEITTLKVRIISYTEKVEKTNWQVFEFQVYGYMSI